MGRRQIEPSADEYGFVQKLAMQAQANGEHQEGDDQECVMKRRKAWQARAAESQAS